MSKPIDDPNWTEAQRSFVQNLEQLGATKAEHAVPIDRTTPPPVRELQALVDSGVVREAAANGYYIYPRQPKTVLSPKDERRARLEERLLEIELEQKQRDKVPQPFDARRFVKTVVFWLIMILIPIVLIELLGKNG
jgi:hypothetical protein